MIVVDDKVLDTPMDYASVRTLGAEYQKVMPLAEAIVMLVGEATPPDLR